jgi:hypothetical protein
MKRASPVQLRQAIKSREEFEAWWSETMNTETMDLHRCSFPLTDDVDQPYACHETGRGWMSWQASRSSPVVELPPIPEIPEEPEEAIDDSYMDAYHSAARMREACAKAIEAAGVKVKS